MAEKEGEPPGKGERRTRETGGPGIERSGKAGTTKKEGRPPGKTEKRTPPSKKK